MVIMVLLDDFSTFFCVQVGATGPGASGYVLYGMRLLIPGFSALCSDIRGDWDGFPLRRHF